MLTNGNEGNRVDNEKNTKEKSLISVNAMPLLSISSNRTINLCKQLPDYYNNNQTIFICSYPKSGTTWMQAIIYHILSYHRSIDLELDHISNFSPFYEIDKTWEDNSSNINLKYINNFYKLGFNVFNTHLYWSMLPKGQSFKYIYMIRSPIDVVVSFYHHLSNQVGSDGYNDTFENFYNSWLNGQITFGSWIDHIISYLQEENVDMLIIKYENLISNPLDCIIKILDYLKITLTADQINNIISKTSFHSMKENLQKYCPVSVEWKEGYKFLRKGIIGDGNSLVSQNQLEELKNSINSKFNGSIPEWFNKYEFI